MKRYDIKLTIFHTLHEKESDNGQWVKFEEANARIEELEEALKDLVSDIEIDNYNYRLATMKKVNKALNK